MEKARNTDDLKRILQREMRHMVVVVEGRGRFDWVVQPTPNKPEAYAQVADIAMDMKDIVAEKAKEAARERREKEDLARIIQKGR